jgi:hypothetical protein
MFLEEEEVWLVSEAEVRAVSYYDNLSDSRSIRPSCSVSFELGDRNHS